MQIIKKTSLFNQVLRVMISLLVVTAIAITMILTIPGGKTILAGQRPTNLGIQSGEFAPCPSSPNCVSSFSQDPEHKIAPLTYNSTPAEAMAKLKKVIQSLERTKIITATDNYLYAEFTSALMGFVDDVQFLLDAEKKVIQVRSASRLGDSDLGVNRQRMETIRNQLN
jgi:uncharacterized protein (DUF1499 family)